MMRCVVICLLWACAVQAQDGPSPIGQAETQLVQNLSPIGTWDLTRRADMVVMQCTDCSGPVTVVVRVIPDYVDGSSFRTAQSLYDAGRRQLCSDLVAQRRGRCLGDGVSVEEGTRVYEYVQPEGRDLLAGYVSAPDGSGYIARITPIVRDAVAQLAAQR